MAGKGNAEAGNIRNKKFTVLAFFERCSARNDGIPFKTVAHNALCHEFKIEFLSTINIVCGARRVKSKIIFHSFVAHGDLIFI